MSYDFDEIREMESNVDLASFVQSRGFDLHQQAGRWWTSCPLHEDKTPSLLVDDKNTFHCFSCGVHGGAVSWLRTFERYSFADAVREVAKIAGVDLGSMCTSETYMFNKNRQTRQAKTAPVEHPILEESVWASFPKNTPTAWVEEGISPEAMRFFDIRFDPKSSRIVYPVRLADGTLIGVKGRSTLSADECKKLGVPKYMNYYEIGTADFLQSLDKTLQDVRSAGEIILFEGIKSSMKAWGWGYKNTAAVESHSINPHQVKLLLSLGVSVTVAFDSDVDLSVKDSRALREALDILAQFTNVWIVLDKGNLLGGAAAKNSPVDLGPDVWETLYKERSRWKA